MSEVILDNVSSPASLKHLNHSQLIQLSEEIRHFIINTLSTTGGHLGANLGVVELTIALHKVFNTPKDKIIWDIGHQSYPHKIITGRKDRFATLRQKGGISGFANIQESEYDHFGAGHSSTSISAALGIALAKKFTNDHSDVIAVIGDASIVSGMAFEALNHAGSLEVPNLTVILNDNNKSILDSVGAIKTYFSKLTSSYSYSYIREHSKSIINNMPFGVGRFIKDFEKYLRNLTTNGFFEALGFYYIGPIDGHNFKHLIPILANIKNNKNRTKPVLLHVITTKGKGYLPAEKAYDNFHGVGKFCIESGKITVTNDALTYSEAFGNELKRQALHDKKIIAISGGTISGTGLYNFSLELPHQIIDVGIAEQHAVTFAAGLATEGFKPYVCLYSTFSQRAYDQIVHDVCLQKLPVRFVLDRNGFVGEDGATHHGLLNHNMYLPLPHIIYMAPFTLEDLTGMLQLMQDMQEYPSFISFPKGNIPRKAEISHLLTGDKGNADKNEAPSVLKIGKGEILKTGDDIAVVAVGPLLKEVLNANPKLMQDNINITIVDPKFLKPLDNELFKNLIANHKTLLTFEANYGGAFFALVYNFFQNHTYLNPSLQVQGFWLQDRYFEHAKQNEQYQETALDATSIYKHVKKYCHKL